MSFSMEKISRTLSNIDLNIKFDAIVIGSGYGGAIAAARLSLAGRKVLVLERGREILPGEYPVDLASTRNETQITTAKNGPLDPKNNGMMDIRINDDMHVILGCGLGGGSLINANVALECNPKVFDDPRWPAIYKSGTALKSFYQMAREGLGTTTLPKEINLPKLTTLETSAKRTGIGKFERAPINVMFEDGPNAFGNMQAACTMCGDCCSGCNYGAKNTTLMNYLPYAAANGAAIATEAKVVAIEGNDKLGFKITVEDLANEDQASKPYYINAELVVLAAGSLGSFEILQRSAINGLDLAASNLGKGFSGNGDVLGFGFDANVDQYQNPGEVDDPCGPTVPLQPLQPVEPIKPVYSIGAGSNLPNKPQFMPGPCITGVVKVDMSDDDDVTNGMVIEDGVAPGALAMAYPAMFFLDEAVTADFTRFPDATRRLKDAASLGTELQNTDDISELSYTGALAQTQSYLVMSHDSSNGVLRYDDNINTTVVDWPGVGSEFPYPRDNDILRKYADAIWSNYLPSPIWTEAFGWNLITVHPVGGCRMADTAKVGVVNADCQVYTGRGDEVYDGLYVCDGSVMPTSLGLNPLLTISAITERAMDVLIKRKKWTRTDPVKPANSAPMMQEIAVIPTNDEETKAVNVLKEYKDSVDNAVNYLNRATWPVEWKTVKNNFNSYFIDNLIISDYAKKKLYDKSFETFKAIWNPDDIVGGFDILQKILGELIEAFDPNEEPADGSAISRVEAVIKTHFGDVSPSFGFSENMSGFVSPPGKSFPGGISDPYEVAAARGRANGMKLTGYFTVTAPSAYDFAKIESNEVKLGGYFTFVDPPSGKKSRKLRVQNGTFQLLVPDANAVDDWHMNYKGDLRDGDRTMMFEGHKTLRRRPNSTWWGDLTTLPIDIYCIDEKSDEREAEPYLSGILELGLEDLAKQAGTIDLVYAYAGDEGASAIIIEMLDAIFDKKLTELLKRPEFWNRLVKNLLGIKSAPKSDTTIAPLIDLIKGVFAAGVAKKFANLVFESYGGIPAYLNNFEGRTDTAKALPPDSNGPLPRHQKVSSLLYDCKTYPSKNPNISPVGQLIRYKGGKKGPVILAPGISTKAQSFAVQTTDKPSFVDMLVADGYDVWLFDYRGSPEGSKYDDFAPYDIDDISANDWPWAVNLVLSQTKTKSLQIVGHCVGALTAQMALLSGTITKKQVRSMISSQLTVHPVTNWFNLLKADINLAKAIYKGLPDGMAETIGKLSGSKALQEALSGRPVIDMVAPDPSVKNTDVFDAIFDMLMYNVPFPNGEPCNSPTCHRIFGIYGPSFYHENLNLKTHNAIKDLFGKVSVKSFEQLGLMFSSGLAANAQGRNVYLPNIQNLDFANHFIAGGQNTIVLPGSSLRTLNWLQKGLPASREKFTRKVYKGYGHMDTFIGKDASCDIFPDLIELLDVYN